MSAFDLGQKAADTSVATAPNPFDAGTAEHNNFEVGRRFGAENSRQQKADAAARITHKPDADEIGFDEGS